MYGNNPFDISGTGVFVGGHLQTHSVFGFEVYLSAKKIPFHVLTKSERLEKRGFLFPLNTSVCSSIYTLMQKFPVTQVSRVFENVWSLFKEQISMYPKS